MHRRRARGSVLALAAGLVAPTAARAMEVDARSTTVLNARQDVVDGEALTTVPLTELLHLSASDLVSVDGWLDGVQLQLSAWGRADPAVAADAEGTHEDLEGDVSLAYIEARLAERVLLRIGRQFEVAGAARMQQFDGLSARADLFAGLRIAAYGGLPVKAAFTADRGESVAGGRLSWRRSYDTEVGISFVDVRDEGREARRDVALDARWEIFDGLLFTGFGSLSTLELRMVEVDLAAAWRAFESVTLTADYRHTAPDLFLPYNSIYRVFTRGAQDEAGGGVEYRPAADLAVRGDYHAVFDPRSGEESAGFTGHRLDGRVNLYMPSAEGGSTEGPSGLAVDTVGAELEALVGDVDGFVRLRLLGRYGILAGLALAGDLDVTFYQASINGEGQSIGGRGAVSYRIGESWEATLSASAGTTPFASGRFEMMAKVLYDGSWRLFGENR